MWKVFTCMRCISISHSARRCCSTVVLSLEAGVMCALIWLSLPNSTTSPFFSSAGSPAQMPLLSGLQVLDLQAQPELSQTLKRVRLFSSAGSPAQVNSLSGICVLDL